MDPEAVVTEFGRCWAEHDLEGALALVVDDIVFDDTEPAPDGTLHRGVAAVREAWRPIFENESSLFEAEDTFAAGTESFSCGATRGATATCAASTSFACGTDGSARSSPTSRADSPGPGRAGRVRATLVPSSD